MYHSTRSKKEVSGATAIINGLADDGGLYVMDELPKINYKDLIDSDYPCMASKILNLFFPDFSYDEILVEVRDAYKSFDCDSVVDIKSFNDIHFLELFHGPTLAFKDLALVVLPRLMKLSKKKLGIDSNTTILTATSGDTGGAALNGFKDIEGISIIVLYPDGGVSPVQEAQMHSFKGNRSFVYALDGNFDDCQNFVKEFFNENKDLNLSSANSINIARLVPQIVYYFYSYIKLLKDKVIKEDELVDYTVPTGNFGNILAGFYAKMMGLPIGDLVCASNANDVLTDYFNNGVYNKNRNFYKTNSPSMDILISSNLERWLYYACGKDVNVCSKLICNLKENGIFEFDNPYDFFKAHSCGEEKTLEIIKDVYKKYNYLIDPHTAVAYDAAIKFKKRNMVVVSTASPLKFPGSVLEAFDIKEGTLNDLASFFNLELPSKVIYHNFNKELIKKVEANNKLRDVITCLK